MGAATVWEIVSALAPGYAVVMVTVGGEISGYCETGSEKEAITPASVTRIAITLAKIGRSMKNFEKLPMGRLPLGGLGRLGLCGGGRGGAGPVGLDGRAGPHLHEVVDDHLVAVGKPGGDHGVGADPVGDLHGLGRSLPVGARGHLHARLLVLQDRL